MNMNNEYALKCEKRYVRYVYARGMARSPTAGQSGHLQDLDVRATRARSADVRQSRRSERAGEVEVLRLDLGRLHGPSASLARRAQHKARTGQSPYRTCLGRSNRAKEAGSPTPKHLAARPLQSIWRSN